MLILALLLPFAAPLLAQQALPNTDIETQIQEPLRKNKMEAEVRKEAEEARKREVSGKEPDVTYQQVLADPDNIELNFLYARSQVKRGNLRSADATLERILLINPNLPKVRLFYVVVLLRLDNLEEAQKEIDTLKKEEMSDVLRAELDGYAKEIRRQRARTHFSAALGAGLDFDDNRNAAPASAQSLSLDIPINLDRTSTRKTDVAKTMLANVTATRELPYQIGHQIYVNASYYRAEQTNMTTLNLQNYSISAGALYKSAYGNITPSFEFNHLLLAETTYLRSRAVKLQFDRQMSPRFDLSAETAYARQIYNQTQVVPTGDQRTGDKIEGGVTVGYVLTSSMKINAGVTHVNQGAREKFDAYRRESFTVSDNWLVGRGQFLLTSLTGNYDRYERPEAAISVMRNRIDDTYRARATYGFPMELIARPLASMLWTFTYEYYQALSSIKNYAYSNNKVSTMLTYQFGF